MSATADPIPFTSAAAADDLEVVPLRHRGRQLAAVLAGILFLDFCYSLITNSRFQWQTVWHYMTDPGIIAGLWRTIWLTTAAMLIGVTGGTLLAVMRLADNALLRRVASLYVWFFRGTPLLVQLIFWFNLSALYPTLTFGVPFGGPHLWSGNANTLITVYVAAILGLGLNEAAYMSEIVRGGINSVDRGQIQAAQALGMRKGHILRRIVLPQAMRVIVPPTGNQVIGMLKTTSLVSVIALPDLLYSAQLIYNHTFQPVPLLIVASLWYLILTTVLSVAQHYIERHYGRGANTIVVPRASWWQRHGRVLGFGGRVAQ
jgi:polar amino acid transport system permease protein